MADGMTVKNNDLNSILNWITCLLGRTRINFFNSKFLFVEKEDRFAGFFLFLSRTIQRLSRTNLAKWHNSSCHRPFGKSNIQRVDFLPAKNLAKMNRFPAVEYTHEKMPKMWLISLIRIFFNRQKTAPKEHATHTLTV